MLLTKRSDAAPKHKARWESAHSKGRGEICYGDPAPSREVQNSFLPSAGAPQSSDTLRNDMREPACIVVAASKETDGNN